MCLTHPQEDAFGRVEAGGVDARGVGRRSLTHDPTRESRYSALRRQRVAFAVTTRHRVHHHEINGAFSGPADLQKKEGPAMIKGKLCDTRSKNRST